MSDSKEKSQALTIEAQTGAEAEAEENSTVVKLSQVYRFEDQEISELDFSGLESITVANMIKANKTLSSSGNFSVLPETDLQYCLSIATDVTGLPIEFFKKLKPRDGIRVKNKVTSFLFGGD